MIMPISAIEYGGFAKALWRKKSDYTDYVSMGKSLPAGRQVCNLLRICVINSLE